jgi:hypothetical protein
LELATPDTSKAISTIIKLKVPPILSTPATTPQPKCESKDYMGIAGPSQFKKYLETREQEAIKPAASAAPATIIKLKLSHILSTPAATPRTKNESDDYFGQRIEYKMGIAEPSQFKDFLDKEGREALIVTDLQLKPQKRKSRAAVKQLKSKASVDEPINRDIQLERMRALSGRLGGRREESENSD